ncbi:MAG: hypothetical protein KC731_21040, partial [Myxococcales bacterium]|nr:hypothetical protein [Myxococcales bacterium]
MAALLAVAPDVAMAENRHPHGHVDLDDDDADVDEDEEAEGLDSPEEDVREPKYRRNSPPMMWAGIVLTSVGGTAVL